MFTHSQADANCCLCHGSLESIQHNVSACPYLAPTFPPIPSPPPSKAMVKTASAFIYSMICPSPPPLSPSTPSSPPCKGDGGDGRFVMSLALSYHSISLYFFLFTSQGFSVSLVRILPSGITFCSSEIKK